MMFVLLRASYIWCLKLRMNNFCFAWASGFPEMWNFQSKHQDGPEKTRALVPLQTGGVAL